MTHPTTVGRGRPVARRALLALTTALATTVTLIATPVMAQSPTVQPTPPKDYNLDANGVDLVTGKLYLPSTDLTIGSGDTGLSYSRSQRSLGYDDQYNTALNVDGSFTTVSIGTLTDTFFVANSASNNGTGAILSQSNGMYIYTTKEGIKYTFSSAVRNERYRVAQYRVTNIVYPSGRKLTIEYDSGYYESCNESGCGYSFHYSRPVTVSSNDGYRLLINYLSDTMDGEAGSGPQFERFMTVANVTATNAAEQYCTASSCPPGGSTWANAQYAWNAADTQETRADALGRATVTTFDTAGRITGVRLPGETSNITTIGYDAAGRVASVTTGSGTWTYDYVDSGNTRITTVTSPTGLQRVATVDLNLGKVTSDRTGTGGTTTYEYDERTRLKTVTAPEGNKTAYIYDLHDNIFSTETTSKDGTITLAASSTFPEDCSNAVLCHLPTRTIDPKGNTTDYEYDLVHGGVLSIKRPAPAPGAPRPETRFSYQQLYAWYKNASGVLTQAASPIWKLIGMSECAAGEAPACIGTAAETRTEISYGAPGTPNNLLPTSITVRAGDNSVSATRSLSYDRYGNVIAVDGSLPGAGDTSTARYNLAREMVGAISPDPDGAGPLNRRATRIGRDAAGRVTTTEAGTVTGTSDTEWNAFSPFQTVTSSFDPATRLKAQDTLTAGGSTFQLIQYGYDADGRAKCIAVRIGLAASADPCQQLGNSTSGYDQLTETIYGSDGRVAKTREGGADTTTATYTPNGQIATLTDGENNRTTYEYDGFDRLSKTRYPVPAKGAQASSMTDYEQLGYDNNSNVTSRRLRDGSSIGYGYDTLSRLIAKDLPGSEPDVTYSYDLLSRPTQAQTAAQTLSFGYDALGRNLTQTGPLGTVFAQFDGAGRRTRLTWPDTFYVTYDYLTTGEMTAIREAGAASGPGVLATFGYDDFGRRTSLTRGNGTSTAYGYDAASRLGTLTQDLVGSSGDLTLGLTYDPVSRITAVTKSNDAYAWGGHYNRNTPYGVNGLNQVVSGGGAALGYDARGNTTLIGAKAYTYSAENLLLTGPSSTMLVYDPLARLFQTGENGGTRMLYDGQEMVGEYDAGNTLQRRYVFGPGVDEPLVWYEGGSNSDRRWLHADERGSVIAVTNSAGVALATNTYDEYGVPGLNSVGRFGYTGQAWLPEIGMWYYKARVYAPKLGRFTQTDPIGYGDGLNWYNYVGSDPVNRVDSDGLCGRSYVDKTTGDIVVEAPCVNSGGGGGGIIRSGGSGGPGTFGGRGKGGQPVPAPALPKPQRNPICPRNDFTDALGKLRALPATAAGLVTGYIAGVAQELAGGPAVHVGVGNNAIQFTGLTGGDPVGFTLGNVQLYGASTGPGGRRGRYDGGAASGNMGSHEEGHTYQFQGYSLAYMAYQFAASKLGNSRTNAMENEADNYADRGPRCQ